MTFEEILNRYKEDDTSYVCEPPAYMFEKMQGEYTVEDFAHIPDNLRMELIDGEFVYMEAPSIAHQRVIVLLSVALEKFIFSKGGKCRTIVGCGVQPKATDDKNVLIPDVVVLCDAKKDNGKKIVGGPELVIEILSPSTRYRDLGVKKKKYEEAGVREYWTIDLNKGCVTVCEFVHCNKTTIYSLDDKISVAIFGGECLIDFKEIMANI